MEPSDDWYDLETLNSIAEICNIGSLDISYDDISEAISYFDDSPRLDFNGISSFFLKNCIASLYLPLQILFSSSVSQGRFPLRWKIPRVTPVHKGRSKFDISNYRPIAKISNIAKLFERIIFKKLSFLIKSYIEPNQHGFMPGRSTATNLAVFTNHCIYAFEDHLQMDTIYTDFAKLLTRFVTLP